MLKFVFETFEQIEINVLEEKAAIRFLTENPQLVKKRRQKKKPIILYK